MAASRNLPILVALISALLWGLWWAPIRVLQSVGFEGLWASVAMSVAALPILAIAIALRKSAGQMSAKAALGGCFVGTALTLYSAALADTSVLRAVLLFYLAPAWSIALEWMFIGRKLRWINALGLTLAALGVMFIFRGNVTFNDWRLGDTVAVLSGMCWATGAALVFTSPPASLRKLGFIACLTGTVVGTFCALAFSVPASSLDLQTPAFPPALAFGCLYVAPVLLATLWSARRLKPATLSFLLTAEIISGVVSAAIFLSEPFGLPEVIGTVLIIAAALTEVVPGKSVQS